MEPVKAAEAVSCTAGDFPRNLARLSNVDKACLDDVAQKLSSDPRAHVVVIGHSDSHETAKGVDQKRADAAKTYLVKERGVDGSRVTVRAAGSTKPLGTDAAANRGVEIWFVPEGAADPQ
jgi:outer membrane protein OmpA-like peptidoglycan-associated protein